MAVRIVMWHYLWGMHTGPGVTWNPNVSDWKKNPQPYLVLLHIAGSITLFPQLSLPFLTSFVLFLPALLLLLVFCFAPPPHPRSAVTFSVVGCCAANLVRKYSHMSAHVLCMCASPANLLTLNVQNLNPGINLGSVDEIMFFFYEVTSLNYLTVLY